MKAYQMMMFLLIFNLTISLVGALHIYNMEYATGDEYDVGEEQSPEAISDTFFGKMLITAFLGAMAAAVISFATKIPADAAFAYSLFASSFWGIAWQALSVITKIGQGSAGIWIVVGIFVVLLGGVFVVGLAQLIRGGWKSYV